MTDFAPAPTFEMSESIVEIAKALSVAQGELGTVGKNKTVKTPKFQFAYADLASVLEEARPVLAKHGLAVIQSPARISGGIEVTTLLAHSSGEWMRGRIAMPCGGDPKEVGGAITYARRYAFSAMVGIATEDSDAPKRPNPGRRKPDPKPLPRTNRAPLLTAFRDHLGIEPEVIARYLGHDLARITDEEAETLTEFGKAIRAGNEEARAELCGPGPAQRLAEEFAADGAGEVPAGEGKP